MNFLKKSLIFTSILTPLFSNALSKEEWSEVIDKSIETKDNLTWNYNPMVLKRSISQIKDDDISILREIYQSEDVLLAEASKYLLASQGNKTNDLILNHYLESGDIKSALYYFNFNFINSEYKDDFWKGVDDKEEFAITTLKEDFKTCSNFKDYSQIGGKDFTFTSGEDFFNQRAIIKLSSNVNLMYLEFELNNLEYPVTTTIYKNDYIIQSDNDKKCSKINKDVSYIELQKIMAIYKKYEKTIKLNKACNELSSNLLLDSKFRYLCVELKSN